MSFDEVVFSRCNALVRPTVHQPKTPSHWFLLGQHDGLHKEEATQQTEIVGLIKYFNSVLVFLG